MNIVKEIERINQRELEAGIYGGNGKGSWHEKYKDSAWVYLGGLSYELSEGDIICFMSQWGEIEDINLVRDKATNKSLGFCFIKYEDQRSTILAVDNFNGIKLLTRTLRCDHVDKYKLPKEVREKEGDAIEEDNTHTVKIGPGHAYQNKELENQFNVTQGVDLWAKPSAISKAETEESDSSAESFKDQKKEKKEKKEKRGKKEKKPSKEKKRKYERELEDKKSNKSERHDMNGLWKSFDEVHNGPDTTFSSSIPSSGSGGAVASWRGKRDPSAAFPQTQSKFGPSYANEKNFSFANQKHISSSSSAQGSKAPPPLFGNDRGYDHTIGGMGRRR